jgi:hypothetical protein
MASQVLLDRGWGKAIQPISGEGYEQTSADWHALRFQI